MAWKQPDLFAQPPEPDIPFALRSSPEFMALWALWIQHRKEKRAKLTPTAIKLALAKLLKLGPERAAKALEHSIANGWQGVFEPKEDGDGTSGLPRGGNKDRTRDRYQGD